MAVIRNLTDTSIKDETSEKGVVAKTSGAVAAPKDAVKSNAGNRNPGPRQAGVTPRPSDKLIVGGDRG